MPMMMSQENQANLIELAMALTNSGGFSADAKAFGFRYGADLPILGVAVFDDFRGDQCGLHIGMVDGKRLTRDILEGLVLLCFHKRGLGMRRLWVKVANSNRHAICTAVKMGFEVEYRERGGFMGVEDAIVLSLHAPAEVEDARQHKKAG